MENFEQLPRSMPNNLFRVLHRPERLDHRLERQYRLFPHSTMYMICHKLEYQAQFYYDQLPHLYRISRCNPEIGKKFR